MCAFLGSLVLVHATSVSVNDSIVRLSILGTTNYVFTEPSSSKTVVIAVTMTPYSSDPSDLFTVLDGGTRMGIGNVTNGGDGNWIDTGEGVNFSASPCLGFVRRNPKLDPVPDRVHRDETVCFGDVELIGLHELLQCRRRE